MNIYVVSIYLQKFICNPNCEVLDIDSLKIR